MTVRGTAVLLVLMIFVAGAGFTGGFVYSHNPQPDNIVVRVSASGARPAEEYIAGTIVRLDDGSFSLATELVTRNIDFDGSTPVDELLRAAPDELEVGAFVNLGGNLAGQGPVLTGVVSLGPAEETQ